MSSTLVRGACPGLSSPMQTGDGLLARFLPAAPIPLDDFIGVCEVAKEHGNGTLGISARGSVQVRGLTEASAPLFAEAIAALGIEICENVPIIADPLPGDPAALVETRAISYALRRAMSESGLQLAPKVSVVIDGGGRIGLDQLFADVRLRALAAKEGPRFRISLAGDSGSATPAGAVAPDEAAGAVLDLLARIAASGPEARAADLLPTPSPTALNAQGTSRADAIGQHPLGVGTSALGVGLAFGHAQSGALAELALIAEQNGADWARPAPGRALLLGPFSEAGAEAAMRAAASLGFVTEASDPRRRIAACPGAPACMHGLIAARALAAELARDIPLPRGDGIALHVSGCAKGCAHPAPAPLTIVGTDRGCGIVRNGTARAVPSETVTAGEIVSVFTGKWEAVHA